MESINTDRNKDGTLKKGVVLNPKGRGKNVLNKTTRELKELVKTYVESELGNAADLLEKLTAKERLDILCKLLPYVMPKQLEVIEKDEKTVRISFNEAETIDYSKLSDAALHEIANATSNNKQLN